MLWRRGVSAVAGVGLAAALPAAFAFSPVPVFAAATSGSNALKTIDEFFSPTTSLQVIKGGAGSGLGTASELGGAGLSVSGEVAGVAADGAISLTPVGWAIAAGLGVGAGGFFAWSNRGQILHAVSSVWNSLSSSQQSSLESSNSPGSSISLPTSALSNYLQSIQSPINPASSSLSGFLQFTLPSSAPAGIPYRFSFSVPSSINNGGNSNLLMEWPSASGQSYSVSNCNDGYGGCMLSSGSSWTGSGIGTASTTPINDSYEINGLLPGQTVYYTILDNSNNRVQNSLGQWSWGTATNITSVVGLQVSAVPVTSVPSSVTAPDPSSSSPTFFPGSQSHGQPEPIGVPASHPLASPATNPLPSGAPSPGFVTFIEDLVVPSARQLEQALAPLQSSFGDRIPFSYVSGALAILPAWVDGVGDGGCASFPIPSFGFNHPTHPGQSGSSFGAGVCPGSFMSGAFSLLKGAMRVLLWAFLLGWGVMLFSSLLRG